MVSGKHAISPSNWAHGNKKLGRLFAWAPFFHAVLVEGAIGFFGFLVLVIFEIGFSAFALTYLRFFCFGIHCSFLFFFFDIRFLLIKNRFSVFVFRLSTFIGLIALDYYSWRFFGFERFLFRFFGFD